MRTLTCRPASCQEGINYPLVQRCTEASCLEHLSVSSIIAQRIFLSRKNAAVADVDGTWMVSLASANACDVVISKARVM